MSDTMKVCFRFNSALTQLDEVTGKFDENEHRQKVLPLRGQIMRIDGVTGCFIARYAVQVEYIPDIIKEGALATGVKWIFEVWALKHDFFPLRCDKVIQLTVEET